MEGGEWGERQEGGWVKERGKQEVEITKKTKKNMLAGMKRGTLYTLA